MFFSFFQFFNGWISRFKELIRLYIGCVAPFNISYETPQIQTFMPNLSPGTGEVVCSTSFIQLSYCSFSFLTWKFGSELTSQILFIVLLV